MAVAVAVVVVVVVVALGVFSVAFWPFRLLFRHCQRWCSAFVLAILLLS